MGVGIAIDVTNKAVVISDCSITGACRYCDEHICVGCSDKPVFIEDGCIVCIVCHRKHNVKVPDHARIFTQADDYFEVYGDALADEEEETDDDDE